MEETKTIKDEVKETNDLLKKLLESGKIKGFKLPKSPSKSQVKKGYVHYLFIRNKEIIPMKLPVEDDSVVVEGLPRIATTNFMYTYKGKPALIQHDFSVEPVSPQKEYEEAIRNKMTTTGHRVLLAKYEAGQIKPKKKISGALIFGIIIALIIAGYLLIRGMG